MEVSKTMIAILVDFLSFAFQTQNRFLIAPNCSAFRALLHSDFGPIGLKFKSTADDDDALSYALLTNTIKLFLR